MSSRATIGCFGVAVTMAALDFSDQMKKSTHLAQSSASTVADMWPLLVVAACMVVAAVLHYKAAKVARQVAVYAAAATVARALKENSM